MSIPVSAFSHHPELNGKISDPLKSFFRDFSAHEVFDSKPELRWVLELLYDEEHREASRRKTLEKLGNSDLWVFAYGSLMWDPALIYTQVRRAHIPKYSRRFILKDVWGGRGTRERPGLMAALDKGEGCEGLAFRISADQVEQETKILWSREMIGPGYEAMLLPAFVGEQPINVLSFVADHTAEQMMPNISRAEQITYLATGSGILGTSIEYLRNIVNQFATLDIVDADCSALLKEAEAQIRLNGLVG